jgi:hypothetical protein
MNAAFAYAPAGRRSAMSRQPAKTKISAPQIIAFHINSLSS